MSCRGSPRARPAGGCGGRCRWRSGSGASGRSRGGGSPAEGRDRGRPVGDVPGEALRRPAPQEPGRLPDVVADRARAQDRPPQGARPEPGRRSSALHREIATAHGGPTANRCDCRPRGHAGAGGPRELARGPNPAAGIKLAKETARDRVLSDVELRRLVAALAASDRIEARVLEFLLATGARKSEALTAKWSDFRDGWWIVPAERVQVEEGSSRGP